MPTNPRLDESVAARLEALLARVEGIRRGSDLHTRFDARGQREAQAIARRDSEADGLVAKRPDTPRMGSSLRASPGKS